MKFSSTITIQYDTPFSPFPARDCHQALDWLRDSGFDVAAQAAGYRLFYQKGDCSGL